MPDTKSWAARESGQTSHALLSRQSVHVAAFANTETGGVLVVGISTWTEHRDPGRDPPVPRDLVDLDRVP